MLFIYQKSINNFLRTVLKPVGKFLPPKFQIPVNGQFTIRCDDGKLIKLATNPTSYLARELFWNGVKGYEYNTSKIFIELSKQSEVIFDIGANIGYYSLLACAYNANVQVYAFEPLPAALRYFKLNVELNGFKNIVVEKIALSDFEGTAKFFAIKNPKFADLEDHLAGDGGLSFKQSGIRAGAQFDVTVDTLDNYVAKNSIKRIDLVKLDTEANEHLVLAGGRNVLQKFRPIIQCEVLKHQIEIQLQKFFTENNYALFKAVNEGLLRVKNLVEDPDLKADYYMVPMEKVEVVSRFLIH